MLYTRVSFTGTKPTIKSLLRVLCPPPTDLHGTESITKRIRHDCVLHKSVTINCLGSSACAAAAKAKQSNKDGSCYDYIT